MLTHQLIMLIRDAESGSKRDLAIEQRFGSHDPAGRDVASSAPPAEPERVDFNIATTPTRRHWLTPRSAGLPHQSRTESGTDVDTKNPVPCVNQFTDFLRGPHDQSCVFGAGHPRVESSIAPFWKTPRRDKLTWASDDVEA